MPTAIDEPLLLGELDRGRKNDQTGHSKGTHPPSFCGDDVPQEKDKLDLTA